MAPLENELIDWTVCTETRLALGPNFVRILGYFREDGTQSVRRIEEAMLSATAEMIEITARACVEHHDRPDELLPLVIALHPMFEETLAILEKGASPLIERQPQSQMGRRFG